MISWLFHTNYRDNLYNHLVSITHRGYIYLSIENLIKSYYIRLAATQREPGFNPKGARTRPHSRQHLLSVS